MVLFRNLTICLLINVTFSLFAQNSLPIPRNIRVAYEKGSRTENGIPGPNYWQNSADYDLKMSFNPSSRILNGIESLDYSNNSPDTLKSIYFHLNPNLYQKGATRAQKIDSTDVSSGVKITKISINGTIKKIGPSQYYSTLLRIDSINLLPKQKIHFDIEYNYTVNKGSHIRTGEVDSGAWFLAYFFPRVAVYDDYRGWNNFLYNGLQEFYNDFCNFRLNVSVPKNYLVWATGNLLNPEEVLAPKYSARLAKAEKSDDIVAIIDSTDVEAGDITANNSENTFRFEARNVTDVAFAISNHYVWKSTSIVVDSTINRRTRVDAVFNHKHSSYREVINIARKTIESMSYRFPKWPFPFSHETVFDGLDEMEYPMMVNVRPVDNNSLTVNLTLHEIFHSMFPFYMGTNETKYGWMDEGWAVCSNCIIAPMIDSNVVDDLYIEMMKMYEKIAGNEDDLPIITDGFNKSYFVNSYIKPALGYFYVKDFLGEDLFFKGLHQYIRDWNGKHPMPFDFFNSMNRGTGVNLNWFWKQWFFDNGYPDLAIGKFVNAKTKKTLVIERKGEKPVPIDLTIVFNDGSSQNIHRSIGIWQNGNRRTVIEFDTIKQIKKITLGNNHIPDTNKKDNVLTFD
jgi:hypothetical protein